MHFLSLSHSSRYLVALSGGADSVALLLCMLREGYEIEAAHCNFQLRGEESERRLAQARIAALEAALLSMVLGGAENG